MTSFITRAIILLLGYAYPAFECFKIVEKNKPEIQQLIFWCQYWIIIAALTVFERIGDAFISWLPMYSEAKLAFIVYLWYPKTKGTTYVYDTFVKPFFTRHELDIDRNINELKTRAGDIIILYGRKSTVYVQARVFDLLQYVAAQSARPRAAQPVPSQSNPVQGPAKQHATNPVQGPAKQHATNSMQSPARQPSLSTLPQSANQVLSNLSTQSQPITQNTTVSDPQQPTEPAPPVTSENLPLSTTVRTEDMEIDSAEIIKEKQSGSSDQNMEQVIRMTRNRLKQTERTTANACK